MRKPICWAVAVLGLMAFLNGCSEDTICCTPECADEVLLTGRLMSGLGPIDDATIDAEYIGPREDYYATLRCRANPDGTYELPVVPGEYRIRMRSSALRQTVYYSRDGLVCSSGQSSPLVIESGQRIVEVDFQFGALQIDLELPEILAEAELRFTAKQSPVSCRGSGQSRADGSTTRQVILDGLLPGDHQIFMDPVFADPPNLDYQEIALSSYGDAPPIVAGEIATWSLAMPVPGSLSGVLGGDWAQWTDETPRVYLSSVEGPGVAMVRAESTGDYTIPIFATVDVRVSYRFGDESSYVGGDDPETAQVFSVGPGLAVDVDPVSIGGLAIRVERDPSWDLDARLNLHNVSGTREKSLVIDSEDTTFVPLIKSDSFVLFTYWEQPAQWRPQWYDRVTSSAEATTLVYDVPGEVSEVTITLEEGGRISGRVLLADGSPATDRWIRAECSLQSLSWSGYWTTDDEGRFLIEGLPDGEVRLAASLSYSQYIWYPGVADEDLAEPISIENAGTVENIEWAFPESAD